MISLVYTSLGYFVDLIELLVIVRCLLSWLPIGYTNPIARLIYQLTEPLMAPIRNMLYKSPLGGPGMVLDFSPVILFLIIRGVYYVIGTILGALI